MTDFEKKIRTELLKLGADPSAKGFEYIVSAMMLVNDDKSLSHKLVTLYAAIGSKHGESYARVERCMRHQVSKNIIKPFPWAPSSTVEKPTLGSFLGGFYNYLIINES